MKVTPSPVINDAVAAAEEYGNVLLEVSTGWTKVLAVARMRYPLDDALRSKLESDVRLRSWVAPRTPHNSADEGFTDDVAKVSISFPIAPNTDSGA